jgi:oligopeptide transport system substrate-binding protein
MGMETTVTAPARHQAASRQAGLWLNRLWLNRLGLNRLGLIRLGLSAAVALALVLPAVPALAQKVLNRGNGPAPATLDSALGTAVTESRITYDLFEGLFTIGPDGKAVQGSAESWSVSPDGLVYIFKLRRDGKWSDGTPVTADDYVFSWRRMVDPATAAEYGYFLWPVKNGQAIGRGQAPVESLGVEAVDPLTLRVTLENPTGYFLASLQHRATFPVSRANYEKFGRAFAQPGNLVSNGAYMLAEYQPQTLVRLVRNPHFHAAATVKIDEVIFHASDSQDTELRRFRAGELDLVQQIPSRQVDWARENIPESVQFKRGFSQWYLTFNMTKEPWRSNPKLREALALTIDRDAIAKKIMKAGEEELFSFVPPGTPGYTGPRLAMASLTQAQRDERARQLLAESGFGPGQPPPPLEIVHPTSESARNIVVAIAAMWKQKLGLDTVLNNQEFRVQLKGCGERSYVGLCFLGWVGDFPDGYTFLKLLKSDIGAMNRAGYSNPDFDRLLDASSVEADPAKRMALMAEAETTLLTDLPVIPLMTGSYRTVVVPQVKGYIAHPLPFNPTRWLDVQR